MPLYTKHKYGFYLYTGDHKDLIQGEIIKNKEFEKEINVWIAKNVSADWLVYDIGSNIGEISEMCSMLGATVHAFDAQADICEKWKYVREKKNKKSPGKVFIHSIGVSDKREDLILYKSKTNIGGSSFSESFVYEIEPSTFFDSRGNIEKEVVQLFAMKDLDLPKEIPDLIKLDIQDFEEKAWDGMKVEMQKAKNVIAEVYPNTSETLINKYLSFDRKAYTLQEVLIAETAKDLVEYLLNQDGNYCNILFK